MVDPVFVKICGITNEDDALLAVAMGADAVGFVFAPSKRQVAPVRAGDIAKRLPSHILTVGVFRNEAPKRVVEIMNRHGLVAAQLHGAESATDTQWIKERVPRVIKAFPAGTSQLAQAEEWGSNPILLDAPTPGSGETFDWRLAQQVPETLRFILAGGLGPDNVAGAIETVRPWGVDVASGVERAPGRKDPVALRAFVTEARAAFAQIPVTAPPAEPVQATDESGERPHEIVDVTDGAAGDVAGDVTADPNPGPYDWRTDG